MTDLERFLNVMNYQAVDRCVYGVFDGPWPETVERWKTEGFDPAKAPQFTKDRLEFQGGWFWPNPPFEHRVIEEDDETVLFVARDGIIQRERKDNPQSSMPQFVKYPVETREDFREFYRERMQPELAGRLGEDYAAKLTVKRTWPLVVISGRWGGMFGGLRSAVGLERLCTLFYDDPAWVEEMMDAVADFIIALMGRILDHTRVDVYGFWEDMAYKNGSLISPSLFRRFALPRYRRVVEYVRSRGVEFIALDSDGDISELIPIWMDAGINTLYPFEVQSGMDVAKVRREYGRDLRIWRGIDKRALAKDRAAIDAELERVRPLVEDGGYIPGLDHSIPPDVPYENYLYYMERLRGIV